MEPYGAVNPVNHTLLGLHPAFLALQPYGELSFAGQA
jgi:hypothetical protein